MPFILRPPAALHGTRDGDIQGEQQKVEGIRGFFRVNFHWRLGYKMALSTINTSYKSKRSYSVIKSIIEIYRCIGCTHRLLWANNSIASVPCSHLPNSYMNLSCCLLPLINKSSSPSSSFPPSTRIVFEDGGGPADNQVQFICICTVQSRMKT